MENYIVINGKKAELTEEQLKKLGIEVKRKNPFLRTDFRDYWFVSGSGSVITTKDTCSLDDIRRFRIANYCGDKALMEKLLLHETLNRLLWRFACENNGEFEDTGVGNGNKWYYTIATKDVHKTVCVRKFGTSARVVGEICFSSGEIAERAIDEVYKPFCEAHPDFDPFELWKL